MLIGYETTSKLMRIVPSLSIWSSSCVTTIMAQPFSALFFNEASTFNLVVRSNALVASSSRSTSGPVARAIARRTRCDSPPDSFANG
mmetsp:Transcript_26730/g.55813  ORF Transcript_26730/g.55813 Transcript_26730/m.55813 type:complete len:87 (-) Transcript_26730:399-659(-)